MTTVLARASAYTIICPRCAAQPGRRCRSVIPTQRGRDKKWPHDARVRAAL